MPNQNDTLNPSYGVRKVNENIMHEGRSLIITNLDGVDFNALPGGTLYINEVSGETKIKLTGKNGWQTYSPLNGAAVPTASEFDELKKQVDALSALLSRYTKEADKSSDILNNAASSVNDLIMRTSNFSEITTRQDQQILEVTRKVNESANWKSDLEKERLARIADFQTSKGWKEELKQQEENDRAALLQAARTETAARNAADKAEQSARAAADTAEQQARKAADEAEQASRKAADEAEAKTRKEQDDILQANIDAEASTRALTDDKLANYITDVNGQLNKEVDARKAADEKLETSLKNKIDLNASKLEEEHRRVTDVVNQVAISIKGEQDARAAALNTEEATRQSEDAALKKDYTTKINNLRMVNLNTEQTLDSQKLDIGRLKERAAQLETQLTNEHDAQANKNKGYESDIKSLQINTAQQQEDLIAEKAERNRQLQDNISSVKNDMAINKTNLNNEIENRKNGDQQVQNNIDSTNNYLNTLVARGGADAIVVDKLIPPNNYVSFVFQDGSIEPYKKNVKTLILDTEENSRTKGLYINGEAALTIAYTDSEYRVYNDTDSSANVRLIFS